MIFNTGGRYSLFENDFTTKLKPLLIALSKKEAELHSILTEAISSGKTSSVYWNAVRRDIKIIYKDLNTLFVPWSETNIPPRYLMSVKQIQHAISSSTIVDRPAKTLKDLLNTNATGQRVKLLYTDANLTFQTALLNGQKNIIQFTTLTQQTLLSEQLIGQTVAEGFITGNLRKSVDQLTGSLWSKLLQDVDDLHFVQAGKFKYTPSYYAELVTRVKFHEAHSYATIDQCANYDTDLVQISSHNTTTHICIPFEGNVYSISGTSKLFPPLFDTPPYHPNCLHLMYPTFISGMQADGTLDAYSDFSLGNIDRPPVPANFIPISKRGVA